jgi:hypothetical protein
MTEKLTSLFGKMQEWYAQFANIDSSRSMIEILKKNNEDSAAIIRHFSASDHAKTSRYAQQESRIKAARSYLLSRAEDEITTAIAIRNQLEDRMVVDHAPLRLNFWGKSTPYHQWLIQKGIISQREMDGFAIELPLSLPEAFNRLVEFHSNWENMLDSEYSNYTPAPPGHPEGEPYTSQRITLIPREMLNDLDGLSNLTVVQRGNEVSILPVYTANRGRHEKLPGVLSASSGLMGLNLYGIKESSAWTAHLVAHDGNSGSGPYRVMTNLAKVLGLPQDSHKPLARKDSSFSFREMYGIACTNVERK